MWPRSSSGPRPSWRGASESLDDRLRSGGRGDDRGRGRGRRNCRSGLRLPSPAGRASRHDLRSRSRGRQGFARQCGRHRGPRGRSGVASRFVGARAGLADRSARPALDSPRPFAGTTALAVSLSARGQPSLRRSRREGARGAQRTRLRRSRADAGCDRPRRRSASRRRALRLRERGRARARPSGMGFAREAGHSVQAHRRRRSPSEGARAGAARQMRDRIADMVARLRSPADRRPPCAIGRAAEGPRSSSARRSTSTGRTF